MKRIIGVAVIFFLSGGALAQSNAAPTADLSYTYGGIRFVDFDDNGGSGLRFEGSYDVGNNWIILGSYTTADFNNDVDVSWFEIGGGYVWSYTQDWDLVGTAQYVRADADAGFGSTDESGFRLSGGVRGLIAPKIELRGSVNYIDLDSSDTYLELAGDYYFTQQFAAGVSLEFAGDTDLISFGARYFFR
jgi:hypothetical protein